MAARVVNNQTVRRLMGTNDFSRLPVYNWYAKIMHDIVIDRGQTLTSLKLKRSQVNIIYVK